MTDTLPPDPNGKKFLPYRQSATPTTDTDRLTRAREIRRQNFAARSLVVDHAILTGAQRKQVIAALDADNRTINEQHKRIEQLEHEVARLARVTPDNPHGYRREFPTAADRTGPTLDEWREEWAHTLGNADNIAEAIGIALGAASMCWENPAGAGTFESDRASVLVDVLTEYVLDQVALRHKACDQRIDLLTEQLNQRDAEITKRWKRNRELNGEIGSLQDQLARAHDERDKAIRDRAWFEHQLNQIRAFVAPPAPDDEPEPGDSWTDHVHERQELARKLRESRGRVVRLHSDTGPRHIYDHDITEQTPPVFRRWNPDHRPTDDELAEAVDMTAAEFREAFNRAMPGPRPGPTPARPHSPSAHMLGRCWCQTGEQGRLPEPEVRRTYPFAPDYTEADVDVDAPDYDQLNDEADAEAKRLAAGPFGFRVKQGDL